MKTAGFFLIGFVVSLLAVFAIGFSLYFIGFVWLSEVVAKTSLLVAIGGGVAVVKSFCSPRTKELSRYEQAELDAFQRAEEWRNK